jgi:hypothetical protein
MAGVVVICHYSDEINQSVSSSSLVCLAHRHGLKVQCFLNVYLMAHRKDSFLNRQRLVAHDIRRLVVQEPQEGTTHPLVSLVSLLLKRPSLKLLFVHLHASL